MTYGRNNTEKAVYTYGEERIAEDDLQTDETAEYLYDGRGSVVQTTIDTEVELSITYDPFGEIISGVDENFVGYAYNGEESSEVTGLQYLRARYYDTELGSFLTIDSYLGSLNDALSQNRYTYANNDPVNNIDPSGHYSVNVNGASQYYQSTGLNEIRDYMTASALWAGEVSAQNGYNNAVARANNTSFQNYASISGISQSTADSYINKGIAQAGQVSMNYGCSVPPVPNEAVAEFTDNVNDARESANAKIGDIKWNKKAENDAYEEYLRDLEVQKNLLQGLSEQYGDALQLLLESLKYEHSLNDYSSVISEMNRWGFIFDPGQDDIADWIFELMDIVELYSNYEMYGFNVNKVGDYAIIKGARTPAAIEQGILGTRYALKNADKYSQVFQYIDPKTAMKKAFEIKDATGKANFGGAWNVLSVGIDILSGVYENSVDETATPQEYVSDAIVDTGLGVGSIWASATAGAAIGSVVPGAGNVVGAIGGLVVGGFIYVATDVIEYEGKKGREWIKEGAEWIADGVVGFFGR